MQCKNLHAGVFISCYMVVKLMGLVEYPNTHLECDFFIFEAGAVQPITLQ